MSYFMSTKWLGREGDHFCAFSVEVKKECMCFSTPHILLWSVQGQVYLLILLFHYSILYPTFLYIFLYLPSFHSVLYVSFCISLKVKHVCSGNMYDVGVGHKEFCCSRGQLFWKNLTTEKCYIGVRIYKTEKSE